MVPLRQAAVGHHEAPDRPIAAVHLFGQSAYLRAIASGEDHPFNSIALLSITIVRDEFPQCLFQRVIGEGEFLSNLHRRPFMV